MSRRTSGWREYGTEIRWTAVVLVLAAAGVIALWPRGGQEPAPDADAPQRDRPPASTEVDPAQRAAADLRSCREQGPAAGQRSGPGQLSGARGTCMADGSPVGLGEAVGDGPAVINVWATWCAPCREELPVLAEYARAQDEVDVLGVQVRSGESAGLGMLRELGVHFPNVHDPRGELRSALSAPNVLPVSYLVTEDGAVHRLDVTVFRSVDEVRAAVDEARRSS
ncbi:TlpA disulfide reductase family protein [Salinifilum aidingensis]